MSTVKRECRVVMLPTQKASNIVLARGLQGKLFFPVVNLERDDQTLQKYINAGAIPQHLYVLSHDEIKDMDYAFDTRNNTIIKQQPNQKITIEDLQGGQKRYIFKIIATTDSSLYYIKDCPVRGADSSVKYILPQPSDSFVRKFMEAYNDEKPIEKVMVDYVKYPDGFDLEDGTQFSYSLKINYKDNTITISKVKDSWDREEVSVLIRKAILDYSTGCSIPSNKWIEENLK